MLNNHYQFLIEYPECPNLFNLHQHFPGKWHQRLALMRVKEACFKRFSLQSSSNLTKLWFNLVVLGCLCKCNLLLDYLSPKPTSSSWPSSATPAPYSPGRSSIIVVIQHNLHAHAGGLWQLDHPWAACTEDQPWSPLPGHPVIPCLAKPILFQIGITRL